MNRERLERLIFLLENLATELPSLNYFNMFGWYDPAEYSSTGLSLQPEPEGCGTAACAMGSAALWPEFQKLGLGIDLAGGSPSFNRKYGYDAAIDFFEIEPEDASYLFNPSRYEWRLDDPSIMPIDVIDHVKEILNREEIK